MTNPEHDEGFEAYLKRRSVLPNALDDRLEPPAALDEIVLRRAREAIEAQGAPAAKQQMARAPRWAMPVALAATILLCLSVVLNISLNTNRPSANLQRMTAARANVNPGAEADARGDGRTNNDAERRESISGDVPSREVVLTEAKVAGSPAPRAPVVADSAQGAPPPAPTRRASAGGPERAAEQGTASAFASAAPPAAAPAPPAIASAAAPPAAAPAPSAVASVAAPPVWAAARVPPGFASTNPSASVAPPAPLAKRADASSPGSATATAGAANAPTPTDAAPHPADPNVWLKQIAALRAAGETDQADAEVRRFRVVFPGYATSPAPAAASKPSK
jgi:hypothetical protein